MKNESVQKVLDKTMWDHRWNEASVAEFKREFMYMVNNRKGMEAVEDMDG